MGIVHRDIKAENVFLSTDHRTIKLGDFGSSRDMFNPEICGSGNSSAGSDLSRRSFAHYVGTPHFISPEAIDNKENDLLSDIWSLGCLFYQVLMGIPPFVAGSEFLIYLRIKHLDLQFPGEGVLSHEAIDLIKKILVHDRNQRPSLHAISMHPFFHNCPEIVPPYRIEDACVRALVKTGEIATPQLLDTLDPYTRKRFELVKTVEEWRKLSQPGSGTAIVDHLHAPELEGLGIH